MVGRGVWGMRAPVSLTVGVPAVGLSACGSMVAMEREAPERRGAYAYQVQIGAAVGRWSNVLRARLAVDAAGEEASRCS